MKDIWILFSVFIVLVLAAGGFLYWDRLRNDQPESLPENENKGLESVRIAQRKINEKLSANHPEHTLLIVDGIWGPLTQAAFEITTGSSAKVQPADAEKLALDTLSGNAAELWEAVKTNPLSPIAGLLKLFK